MQYRVFKTKKEASKAAYNLMKELMTKNSVLGLATGSTPIDLYEAMIEDYKLGNFSYKDITTYNLDEYVGISYSHPESYHKFMKDKLFDSIDIKEENINIPDASSENLQKAIEIYQKKIDDTVIDIQILGVGSNGHIGFNEPGTPFNAGVHLVDLKTETIEANSRFFDNDINLVPKKAVTMGISDIMKAKNIILLAFGKEKKEAIKSLVAGLEVTSSIPCTVLKQHSNVFIFVDEEADFN